MIKRIDNRADFIPKQNKMGNKETLPPNISSLKPGNWVEAGEDQ